MKIITEMTKETALKIAAGLRPTKRIKYGIDDNVAECLMDVYKMGVQQEKLRDIAKRSEWYAKGEAVWLVASRLEKLGYSEDQIISFLTETCSLKLSTVKANLRERKKAALNPESLPKRPGDPGG